MAWCTPQCAPWLCADRRPPGQINKPYLPLASGELSMAQGQSIVLGTGFAALVLGALTSPRALRMCRWPGT